MNKQNGKSEAIHRLQMLRNIGPAMAERLYSAGIRTPEQVKQSDPERLYEKLKKQESGKLDICALYQVRGAVLDIPWPECKNLTKGRLNKPKKM